MAYVRCPICKRYDFTAWHKCPPKWLCRMQTDDDFDEDAPVFARDAEEAAKEFAERWDQSDGDYSIVMGRMRNDPVVLVKKLDDETGKIEKFSITGESVPTYYAHQISEV